MDNKVKTGILATATSFLNQFQEYRAAKVFCPNKDDRTILSMNEVVDKGEVILFDIESPALARSMGTIMKLHYHQSILRRVADKKRGSEIPALFICDEYQDVATSGAGITMGDESFYAKSRQSNAISIVASQSLASLQNSLRSQTAAKELIQNFRTRICFHSSDMETIKNMQELIGQEDFERESLSISEIAQKTERNLLIGGFDSKDANISESISVSKQKEYILTGKEFTSLKTFEAWAIIFDGTSSKLKKLYMKPLFLKKRETTHKELLMILKQKDDPKVLKLLKKVFFFLGCMTFGYSAMAFPNICDVVKQSSFRSCFQFDVKPDICGSPPAVWSCARVSYFVPQTFIETTVKKGVSHFSTLPGAAAQLASAGMAPYGAVNDDDTQSFEGRTIAVPLTQIAFAGLPCGGERQEKMCFDGMSEHLRTHWATGRGDLKQPLFLAWKLSPKLCLMKGAVSGVAGGVSSSGGGSMMCSVNMDAIPFFPPSQMPVCTAWGVMFPRYGTQVGGSEIIGSLSIASRIKSLSVEVFQSMPSNPGEKWSMVSPNSSQCFREFENIASIETFRLGNNRGRVMGKELTGNLFSTWKRVSCKTEWAELPFIQAEISIIEQVCKGL